MSYTEYLSRKKAAAPVILDVRPKMDASTYTRHQRVVAAANIYAPTKSVVGNINDMRTSVGRDNNAVKAGVRVTLATGQGGDVPDASTFSDYAAGRAAEMDYRNGPPGTTKVVLNASASSVPAGMTSISGCNMSQAPFLASSGTITAATYVSATGVVTFTASNNYVVGEYVTISGITGAGTNLNTVFNVTNTVITSAGPDQFTIKVATGLVAVAGASFAVESASSTTTTRTYTGTFTGFTTGHNVIAAGFTNSNDYNVPLTGITTSNPATLVGTAPDITSFNLTGTNSTGTGAVSPMGVIINTSLPTSGSSSVSRISNPNRTYPSGLTKYLVNNPELTVAKNASNNTKTILQCFESNPEPHTDPLTPVQKGIHHFVDDHISLNSGTFRIGTGSSNNNGSTIQSSNSVTGGCPPAIHTISAILPRPGWGPRPSKGAGGLFNPVVPSQDRPYKAGALVPSDHIKYVEKHHGNDSNVNPRRYPKTPYQIPAGTPAHLKINDEHRGI